MATTGLDGKVYPARWYPLETREWLKGRVHYLSHDEHLSVRKIQRRLADEHNVRRSVGWVSTVLCTWECTGCSGGGNSSPEHLSGGWSQ